MRDIKETFKNKKILVTGANGFIGSHIVNRMLEYESKVSIIVRENADLWRLEHQLKDLEISKVDIRDRENIHKAIDCIAPDFVFHMAAYGVDSRQKDYLTAADTNICGTINLLNALVGKGCEKFIFSGTSMQYGNKEGIVVETERLTPSNIYGSTKAAAVMIAHQIAAENNLPIVTLVPFGVFGENEGSHKFFSDIILKLVKNQDVELTMCEQYRDYCYIQNAVDGYVMAAANPLIKNDAFNIGCGVVRPLKHYVDLIVAEIETEGRPLYGALEYRKNDLWRPEPDVSKIKSMLGWEPKISLEDGIKRTVAWFVENHKLYESQRR